MREKIQPQSAFIATISSHYPLGTTAYIGNKFFKNKIFGQSPNSQK